MIDKKILKTIPGFILEVLHIDHTLDGDGQYSDDFFLIVYSPQGKATLPLWRTIEGNLVTLGRYAQEYRRRGRTRRKSRRLLQQYLAPAFGRVPTGKEISALLGHLSSFDLSRPID